MTQDELKLALEALLHVYHEDEAHPKTLQAINAIKEALAQTERPADCERCNRLEEQAYELVGKLRVANIKLSMQPQRTEQEPAAWCAQSELDWLNSDKRGASAYVKTTLSKRRDGLAQTALYTAPPQRTWVGLSTDEFKFIASKYLLSREAGLEYFQEEIESKLREKNT